MTVTVHTPAVNIKLSIVDLRVDYPAAALLAPTVPAEVIKEVVLTPERLWEEETVALDHLLVHKPKYNYFRQQQTNPGFRGLFVKKINIS